MTANRPAEGMLTISPPSGTPSVIPFVAYSSSYVFSLTADKVGRWTVNLQADDFCSGFSSAIAYFDVAQNTIATPRTSSTQPFVSTDKTTYTQGESINFTGQGFTPNGPISACLTTDNIDASVCLAEPNADVNGYASGTMLVGPKIPIGQQAFYVKDVVSGLDSNRVEVTISPEFDFTLTANGDISVIQGGVGSGVSIAVTLTSGSPQYVSLSCSSGLPSGASCSFKPSSGSPTFSSALTVSTSTSTAPGTYQVTVIGVAGATTRATSFSLTIIEPSLETSVATGSGSVNPYCPSGCRYQAGQSVPISSMPGNGWAFSSWNGGYCSAGASVNPCSVVMNGDVTVSANFNMPTVSDRTINVIYWLLGQEQTYTQGQTTFAEALTSSDQTRAYTDSNARLALALTLELELLHKNSTESTWCGSQNCPNLYGKIKVALQFVLKSQSNETNDFYHYWDLSNHGWGDRSGKLYYWNAAVLEGLAIVATKMRWNGFGDPADNTFYDNIIKVVEKTLNSYQGSQNRDGSWNFVYINQGVETQDTQLAENGELLAALVAVSTYELNLSSGIAYRNVQMYAGWAQSLANWLLGLQENHTDRTWTGGGGYGGFYDNPELVDQSSSSNGRAVFGLALYGFNNAAIFQPNQAQIRNAIEVWLDDWVNRTHDQYWGPLYTVSAAPNVSPYPKSTFAAAALGTTTASGWNFFNDEKYKTMANSFYLWATGNNEQQTDLQNVWNGPVHTNVGFDVEIATGHSINPLDSNVETNLEMLQLMVALSDPSVIWNISSSSSTSSASSTTPKCVIATAAYGSELAAPVQFLRNFRDNEVQKTALGANFMVAFNRWYYSWAPTIAQQIAPNENYKAATRMLISPLIGSLYVSHMVFAALAPASPELAVLLAGLLASAILGLIYLGPVYGLVWKLSKRRMTKRTICNLVVVAAALTFLATLTTGTFNAAANLTALAVVETLLLTPALILRKITPVMKNRTAA